MHLRKEYEQNIFTASFCGQNLPNEKFCCQRKSNLALYRKPLRKAELLQSKNRYQ